MSEGPGPSWPADIFRRPLVQPDQRSCGAASLVVARMLLDPGYLQVVQSPESFRSEVLEMHRRSTSITGGPGRLQLPWPRALGTPPWAVANQLEQVTGRDHDARLVLRDRAAAYERMATALRSGQPVPVYVGSRWLPRHVVLAVEALDDGWRCYEPASGRLVEVTRRAFVGATLALAGWDKPWFLVLPDPA